MAVLDMTRFVERLRYFDGQRLFADDLQGVEAFNREMRWLHNRSLHQPGIGSGLAVAGRRGDREVRIQQRTGSSRRRTTPRGRQTPSRVSTTSRLASSG